MSFKPNWSANLTKGMLKGVVAMATDIHRQAIVNAPKASRALVNSGRIKVEDDTVTVSFGSPSVPYAGVRERSNKKNPQTVHYLENAADTVTRTNLARYFKGVRA